MQKEKTKLVFSQPSACDSDRFVKQVLKNLLKVESF